MILRVREWDSSSANADAGPQTSEPTAVAQPVVAESVRDRWRQVGVVCWRCRAPTPPAPDRLPHPSSPRLPLAKTLPHPGQILPGFVLGVAE